MRAPLSRTVYVFGALLVAGCVGGCVAYVDHGNTPCSPAYCDGCCTANGVCLPGTNVFACGVAAGACRTCSSEQICSSGICRVPGEDVKPPIDGGPEACGPQSCDGCCADGECVPLAQETDNYCGQYGMACRACPFPQSCVAGYCETPEGCHLTTNLVYAPGHSFGELDFGPTPVGATARIDVTFRNTGAGACDVSAPTFLGGTDLNAFSFNGQPTYPFHLEPGETSKLAVTFTPYAPNDWPGYANAFTFVANDDALSECATGEAGCRRVVVLGSGVDTAFTPRAPVLTGSWDLGEVTVGCESAWRQVLLINESTQPLTLSQASVSGDGFELQGPALPATVAPWSSLPLNVRYAPEQPGQAQGALSLTDSVGGVRTFELAALGVSTATRTETFLQESGTRADLLFVISTGPTMLQPQMEVSAAMGAVWAGAMSYGASLHAGVISTDVSSDNAGRLQGSPRFITNATPNAMDAFGKNVRLGANGKIDQALESTRLALAPPNGDDPLRNGGFLREGARLGVVIVTDSADKSGAAVDDYVRALRLLARGPVRDRVRTYPIAPSAQCQTGGHYSELVWRTGGLCQTLGATSMQAQLQAIVSDLFRPRDEYELSQPLDPAEPFTVLVDSIPATSGTQFFLDSAYNSVHFAPNSVPETGQTIKVTYSAPCHP